MFSHYTVCPDADELEWYIPATVLPSHLQRSLNIINQYLETPLDLEGKKPAELMKKKPRRRTRRKREPTPDSDAEDDPEAELRTVARRFDAAVRTAERAATADGRDAHTLTEDDWRHYWPR